MPRKHKVIKQEFQVSFNYDVCFTKDLFDPTNALFANLIQSASPKVARKVLFVFDEGMYSHHPDLFEQIRKYAAEHEDVFTLVDNLITIPGGEAAKNDSTHVDCIHKAINDANLDRHSYVTIIGGGAVIDTAGYAAATAHRGIRTIRVPTTVLAQNDAAVGVKNGINAFGKKNFLGTFVPPFAVINDVNFLETLDQRDWRSGISEAIKVALLKDADFFSFLEEHAKRLNRREEEPMQELIYRCAELHLDHIATSGDPFEMGSSRPLDFGHWAAHKLEQLTNYELRHGEAVAIGIALDVTYSYLDGLLSEQEWEKVLNTFKACGFNLYVPELQNKLDQPEHEESIFRGLEEFREHLGGELTIMLLEEIGKGIEVHEVDYDLFREAISKLETYEKQPV
ncbi:3-dehydroquinate synthase [Aliifodinibius sp. S!AR15-10]|uniref:3-dehydroquinate synthase n=1 Tax=Aliifodinibius sp. S!AR15-10 TaxID=2950437 RepID=UPI002859F641|nr:3-dehydroquinate synthase [Aliifodinibius sp. S!AR15-10]MDR8391869.1 3-dehydroquinate synthase [Aliifodinibius sp. S!AR15-10]